MDLLSFIFPKPCLGCGKLGGYLCQDCLKSLPPGPLLLCPGCGRKVASLIVHPDCKSTTSLDCLIAAGDHRGILQRLVKEIKYRGHFDTVSLAVAMLVKVFPCELKEDFILTAVPLHASKHRERGFNQAELIAKKLGKELHLPYIPLLKKIKSTPSQAGQNREKRRKNLQGSFKALGAKPNVILVDDVFTTGSTLNECAKVLKQAGCQRIMAVVLSCRQTH